MTKLKFRRPLQKFSKYVFIFIFAGLGVFFLVLTLAAAPTAFFEAESATQNNTTVASDTNASSGQYLKFASPSASYIFPPTGVQWYAGHEDGTDSEWVSNQGAWWIQNSGKNGASYDYGIRNDGPSKTGNWALWMQISQWENASAGVRAFRQREIMSNQANGVGTYHSAWIYIPQHVTNNPGANNFWNIWQWKARVREVPHTGTDLANDPIWALHVYNRSDTGNMYLGLSDKVGQYVLGDKSQNVRHLQTLKDMPVGKWFHIESYILPSSPEGTANGRIIVWQDGIQLWDMQNIHTLHKPSMFPAGDSFQNSWSVNLYGAMLTNTATGSDTIEMWVDDVAVDTKRIGHVGN